jgi:O-antigen/teichoic acid export membrane protein
MSGFRVKNVFYNWGGLICTVLYGFFMTPFIVHRLGDENYGLWNLVMTCVGYMTLLDFGIQSSVNRYIAKYKGANDMEGVNKIYTNAITIYLFIALLTVIVGLIVTFYMDQIFKIAASDIRYVRMVMIIMLIYTALEFPFNVYGAMIYAYQRFDILNSITAITLAIQALLTWYFLSRGGSLLAFAGVIITVGLMKYVAQFCLCHRIVRTVRFRFDYISASTLKTIFQYSVITFAAIIANYVIFKTDNIVIGIFLGPKAITMYAIGFMISEYIAQVIGKIGNTLTPLFSEHESRGEITESKTLLLTSSRFSVLIGVPMGLTAIILGRDFITLWMGQGYSDAYLIMVLIMCARMCGFPTVTMYSMLYGIGRHYIILYTGIFEAVLNLGLSLYLVRKIGILGVAWGTLIPMFMGNILFVILASRQIRLGVFEWLKQSLFQPAIFCAIFFGAAYYYCQFFIGHTWPILLIQGAGILVLYGVLLILFGLKKEERSVAMRKLSRLLALSS